MLQAIDNERRATLLRAASFLVALPVLVIPLGSAASTAAAAREGIVVPRYVSATTPVDTTNIGATPERDPFANDAPSEAPAAVVRAIITGERPHALVDEGGRIRIVGVGDDIGATRVVRIDGTGITFENGVRVTVRGIRP